MSTTESEQVLAVDVGNNQIKLALFASGRADAIPGPDRVSSIASAEQDFDRLADWLPVATIDWCVASVHRDTERRLAAWVEEHRPQDPYRRLENEHLPIEIRVDAPDCVGTDRLLAGVAVNRLRRQDRPAVVVDAGSAITVDLVSAEGRFEGGVILPGFGMSANALARGTDLLPLVERPVPSEAPPVLGKSTVGAIRSGLFWGTVGAVREVVSRLARDLGVQPQLFVAGGDAEKLAPYLAKDVQIIPALVLAGIAITHQTLEG